MNIILEVNLFKIIIFIFISMFKYLFFDYKISDFYFIYNFNKFYYLILCFNIYFFYFFKDKFSKV